MFSFVHEVMETYQKKLVSLANNRVETDVALCFQGINAHKLANDEISITEDEWYTVQSQTACGEYYSVNTTIGFCTCPNGTNGSPCVHQAAVVIKFEQYGLNYVCSTSSSARKILAQIALGESAITDSGFYSSLHQESLEEKCCSSRNDTQDQTNMKFENTVGTSPLLWGEAHHTENNNQDVSYLLPTFNKEQTCKRIKSVAADLKRRLKEEPVDEQLVYGDNKFAHRYFSNKTNAMLTSALNRFGCVFEGSVTSRKFGKLRHGRTITVQVTAAGKQRGMKRGKVMQIAGRLAGNNYEKYSMVVRNEAKGKRVHCLSTNVTKGTENAGKW